MTSTVAHSDLLLSAVVVVGPRRARAQRVVDALWAQTAVDSIEVIIVDLAPPGVRPLRTPATVRVHYIRNPGAQAWSKARSDAVRQARAPVVAFLEDHCYPAPGWAQALIERYRSDWAAVGYAYTNANPDTYVSRAAMVNDYGFWMHPAPRGQMRLMPGNNISYRRELLSAFGADLEPLLTPDFGLQAALAARCLPMCLEPKAMAAHENWPSLGGLLRSNFNYSRFLGARRARTQSWGALRRLLYACLTPASSPVLGALRLFGSTRGRRSVAAQALAGLPVLLLTHFWSGIGEALGYVFGEGATEADLYHLELVAVRTTVE